MNNDLASQLLVLLIILIGFIVIVAGKNSGRFLRYLFAPIFSIFGTMLRLIVLIAAGFVIVQMLPSFNWGELIPEINIPAPAPKTQLWYPVGREEVADKRSGRGWQVTQDFADTINPVALSLSGQHLGEDWVPTSPNVAGEPVFAIAEGTVILNEQNDSFGRVIMIRHTSPGTQYAHVTALYGHITADDDLDKTVIRGQRIGTIATKDWNGCPKGCTFTAPGCKPRSGSGTSQGNCHGWPEHLHFELRSPTASQSAGFGYSSSQQGFLNPTDRGSSEKNSGNGWIDQWW